MTQQEEGTNILNALVNLKQAQNLIVTDGTNGNKIQIVGSGLEEFIKQLFANTFGKPMKKTQRNRAHSKIFSYAGNANNPPDIIIRNGDAIEVKKADSLTANIQLNSSPPKASLLASDSRINNRCRQLAIDEGWSQKDIIYAIGSLSSTKELKRLWFIYGDCFAADHSVYERAAQSITDAISQNFDETGLATTNELAGVPNVDPLGITYLRVRGMWIIKNPAVVFKDLVRVENNQAHFRTYCLMLASKFESIDPRSISVFMDQLDDKMKIQDVEIADPNNTSQLMKAKLISYEI